MTSPKPAFILALFGTTHLIFFVIVALLVFPPVFYWTQKDLEVFDSQGRSMAAPVTIGWTMGYSNSAESGALYAIQAQLDDQTFVRPVTLTVRVKLKGRYNCNTQTFPTKIADSHDAIRVSVSSFVAPEACVAKAVERGLERYWLETNNDL